MPNYSGKWKLPTVMQAEGAGTWPIVPDPGLYSWGSNNSGGLGLGDLVYRSVPTQVGALNDWLNVAAGQYYGAATKTDGTLWGWGKNDNGQLGDGSIT